MLKPIKLINIPTDRSALEALKKMLGDRDGEKVYQKIVRRIGREPGRELGHGMKGVVYDLGDGRVLKLTSDASEVEAMSILKGTDHPNLIRAYDSFVVCQGHKGVGVVVREWVGRTLEEIEEFDSLSSDIRNAVDEADEIFGERVHEEISRTEALKGAMEDLLILLGNLRFESGEDEVKILDGLIEGISALSFLGIYGIDFNPKNSAVDAKGNPMIFDVGVVLLGVLTNVDRIDCPVGKRVESP